MAATLQASGQRDWQAGLAALAMLAALVWLGLNASKLFWTLWPTPQASPHSQRSVPVASATPPTPSVNLASLHLFGQAGAQVRPAEVETPETQLNLTLLGTLAGDVETQGLAIIADEVGRQSSYAVGEELPGGATLREIFPDHVVLERGGVRESLRLNRQESAPSGSGRRHARSSSTPSGAPLGAPPGIDWEALRNQQRLDPERLAQLGQNIRALPFTENGKPIGVRLMSTGDSGMLTRLGLRSSDIVLAVNDIPLNDPSRQPELLGLLRGKQSFQVRVRRNGREMTVNVDASKLTAP